VKAALALATAPEPKSLVLLVRGLRGSEKVRPLSGLGWSGILQSHYVYVGGDSAGWLSWPMSFEGTVDGLDVSVLRWPNRKPVGSTDLHRIFLEIQDTSPPGLPPSKTLVFPSREVTGA